LQLQQMTGQVDVMCSCSLMMGERLKKWNWSKPYLQTQLYE
jgi:hypothetical protein